MLFNSKSNNKGYKQTTTTIPIETPTFQIIFSIKLTCSSKKKINLEHYFVLSKQFFRSSQWIVNFNLNSEPSQLSIKSQHM